MAASRPSRARVDKVIGEFAQRGIKPADLEKAISSYRASAIWGLDSIEGKVSQLAMGRCWPGIPTMCSRIWMPSPGSRGLTSGLPDKFIRTSLPWC